MKILRIAIYLSVFIVLSAFSLAQEQSHFVFNTRPVIYDTENIETELTYKLKNTNEDRFIVRPVVSHGVIYVWNNEWISGLDYWNKMPHLQQKLKLKINGFSAKKTALYFQVQDTKLGKVFRTNTQNIWNGKIVKDHLNQLNARII